MHFAGMSLSACVALPCLPVWCLAVFASSCLLYCLPPSKLMCTALYCLPRPHAQCTALYYLPRPHALCTAMYCLSRPNALCTALYCLSRPHALCTVMYCLPRPHAMCTACPSLRLMCTACPGLKYLTFYGDGVHGHGLTGYRWVLGGAHTCRGRWMLGEVRWHGMRRW